MKALRLALAAAAFAVCGTSANAGWFQRDDVISGESFVKRNCTMCHGPSLQGFTTAPRIAGQQALYIESQIGNFKTHSRDNPLSQQYMWGASTTVYPEWTRDVAAYLSTLETTPAADGDPNLVESGRAVFYAGQVEANIPACVACHGPSAQGAGAIPRLGGLSFRYLKRRLAQWGEGYHATARAPMPAVASELPEDQINALASFLSFQE